MDELRKFFKDGKERKKSRDELYEALGVVDADKALSDWVLKDYVYYNAARGSIVLKEGVEFPKKRSAKKIDKEVLEVE